MADTELIYDIGTVSVTTGGVVTVSGAAWSSVNVRAWDQISIDGGGYIPIRSVTDATHAQLLKWTGGVKTNVAYTVVQSSPYRYVGGKSMADVDDMLRNLNTEGWYRYVNPFYAGPTEQGLVANEGQFAFKYTSGQLWIMSSGVWNLVGVYKGISAKGTWNSGTAYGVNDVVSLNGTSYLAIAGSTNQSPPNATYWQVLAAKGDTGATGAGYGGVGTGQIGTFAIGQQFYVVLPLTYAYQVASSRIRFTDTTDPNNWAEGICSYYAFNGTANYLGITIDKLNGSLTTGRNWAVNIIGEPARNYGGTSTTSQTIGSTGVFLTFTTQANLAWQFGARIRATTASNATVYMEGVVQAYSGTTLQIYITKFFGSGTFTDWLFNVVGEPGSGDLLSSNNLSDLANKDTALNNLRGLAWGFAQSLSDAQKSQARTNAGVDTATFTKSAAYTVALADYGALIKCSGTWTLAFTAAATLGDKFKIFVRNTGTGTITLDPNGSELIDGATTVPLLPGTGCWIICDGTGFLTIGRDVTGQSLGSSGYVKLSSGLIIQWGNLTGGSDQGITLPIAFTTAMYFACGQTSDSGVSGTQLVNVSSCDQFGLTSFSMRHRYANNGGGVNVATQNSYWFAIGR